MVAAANLHAITMVIFNLILQVRLIQNFIEIVILNISIGVVYKIFALSDSIIIIIYHSSITTR